MLSEPAGCAPPNPGVMSSMPAVSGITQTRVHSREAEALEVRLIDKVSYGSRECTEVT